MTVYASTLSLLTKIFLMVVSSGVVNGACQPASRDYQLHQGNIPAFYPSPMQDYALKDTIYRVTKASSDVVCAVYCLQDDSCKSFNYCNDKVCHLKTTNSSVKGSAIQLSAGCRHYRGDELRTEGSGTTLEDTSLCAQNIHLLNGFMELQLPMTSPMRLEFTVNTVGQYGPFVYFSPNGPGREEAPYRVTLYHNYAGIYTIQQSSSTVWNTVQSRNGVKYTGVPVMITYDSGRFEVAVQGVQDSTLTCDVPSPPQPSWFVTFETPNEIELNFTEPCISDFNPQFR